MAEAAVKVQVGSSKNLVFEHRFDLVWDTDAFAASSQCNAVNKVIKACTALAFCR